jgi:hypothetical protein
MPDIEYSFGTGQGDPHVHHSQANVDVNGDGVADGVALDFDGDGRVDDVMWDSDGDGIADTALLDHDNDGKAESAYHDPTGQGTWNAEGQGGTPPAQQPPPAEAPPPAQAPPTSSEPAPEDPKPEQPTTDAPLPEGHTSGNPDQPSDYQPYDHSGDGDDSGEGLFDDLVEHASDDTTLFDNLLPDADDKGKSDEDDDPEDNLFDDDLGDDTSGAREDWYEELET